MPPADRGLLLDVAVAVVLFVVGLAAVSAQLDLGPAAPWMVHPSFAACAALVAATTWPVAVRRRLPVLALAVSAAGLVATRLFHAPEYQVSSIGLFLCIYAAGRWGRPPWRDRVRVATVVALLATLFWIMWFDERQFLTEGLIEARPFYLLSIVGVAFNLVFIGLSWLLGDSSRQRDEAAAALRARTAELEFERTENARRAVSEERLRIARELHDVVAHHVSVTGIQAGAARRAALHRPEEVGSTLAAIEQSSREAVEELQRLLGFLRREDVDAGRVGGVDEPVPGLDAIDDLRHRMADAGLALSFHRSGEPPADLSPAVGLSAYRILQESLTNVLKHAEVEEARVDLRFDDDELELVVRDHGRPSAGPAVVGTGSGLVGMRERAALVGGDVVAGPAPGGGFEVRAVLPYRNLAVTLAGDPS